ncbi:hypothetical protein DA100_14725 [Vibrio sp. Hep-1b-8]|nr:hypothetical protein DA100_14725 [Vibrio sp. Hep-1b-8]
MSIVVKTESAIIHTEEKTFRKNEGILRNDNKRLSSLLIDHVLVYLHQLKCIRACHHDVVIESTLCRNKKGQPFG